MKNGNCKCCGAPLPIEEEGADVIVCKECGNIGIFPIKTEDRAALGALKAGDGELDCGKFHEALEAFHRAEELSPEEPLAHFGTALASYRVRFVHRSGEKPALVPVSDDLSDRVFQKDRHFLRATELATETQRKEFLRRAAEIDAVRKNFIDLQNAGVRYDCLICAKQPTEGRALSQVCYDAEQLYRHLLQQGYNPYYAPESQKERGEVPADKLNLYAAWSARCLILVAADAEELKILGESDACKNFLFLKKKKGEDVPAMVVCRGTPPDRLPGIRKRLQTADLSAPQSYGAIEIFLGARMRKELFFADRREYTYEPPTEFPPRKGTQKRTLAQITESGVVTEADLAKAEIVKDFLRARDFDSAKAYLSRLIEENPYYAEAYFSLYLAENGCCDEGEFINAASHTEDFTNLENALVRMTEKERRLGVYSMLCNAVLQHKELFLYNEYVQLPESDGDSIAKLTQVMFEAARSNKDTAVFNSIIQTVTDAKLYLSMNLAFANLLTEEDATPYYANVLSVDGGHHEALYHVFLSRHGYTDEEVFLFCTGEGNVGEVEEALFSHGYNAFAADRLFTLAEIFLKDMAERACILFDFLLNMIPKEEEELFSKKLNRVIEICFENGKAQFAGKYNDALLYRDSRNDEAFFNRMLIKRNLSSAMALVSTEEKLLEDPDFYTAVNLFAENNPVKTNIYIKFNKQLETLRSSYPPKKRKVIASGLQYSPFDNSDLIEEVDTLFGVESHRKQMRILNGFTVAAVAVGLAMILFTLLGISGVDGLYFYQVLLYDGQIGTMIAISVIFIFLLFGGLCAYLIHTLRNKLPYRHSDLSTRKLKQSLSIIVVLLVSFIMGITGLSRWGSALNEGNGWYLGEGYAFQFYEYSDSCQILGFYGGADRVTIPAFYGEGKKKVEASLWNLQSGDTDNIRKIVISDGITEIPSYAFYGCEGLADLVLPESVVKIGTNVFQGCPNLTAIRFNGSQVQWEEVYKSVNWNSGLGQYAVYCRDQTIWETA